MGRPKTDKDKLAVDIVSLALRKRHEINSDEITEKEYSHPWKSENALSLDEYEEFGSYSNTAVDNGFGSWNKAKEELGLDKNESGEVEPVEMVEILKSASEEGKAPSLRDFEVYRELYSFKDTDLFHTYTDAVWLAGLEPRKSWLVSRQDPEEKARADMRRVEADVYWATDPEESLEGRNFDVPEELDPDHPVPRQKDIEAYDNLSKSSYKVSNAPDVKLKHTPISKEDAVGEILGNDDIETWGELRAEAKEQGVGSNSLETLMDPSALPEDGGSLGRWMDQENFPEGILPRVGLAEDPRPSYAEINYFRVRKKELELRLE